MRIIWAQASDQARYRLAIRVTSLAIVSSHSTLTVDDITHNNASGLQASNNRVAGQAGWRAQNRSSLPVSAFDVDNRNGARFSGGHREPLLQPLLEFHMLLAVKIRARPKWKMVTPLLAVGALCLATAGAIQSVSAVTPIGGAAPLSETGALPSAMKPGLFGPPANGGTPDIMADGATSEFARIAGGPIIDAGPAARRFSFAGTAQDRGRAAECLAMAVYYEAASEGVAGQQAVAQVVLNRVNHPAYPAGVCNVVFQGSERVTGCQFSFTCDGSMARKPSKYAWVRALDIANKALAGEVFGKVGLATHYHTHAVNPVWAPHLHPVGALGEHRFYRWRGKSGTPVAFTTRHGGFERSAHSFIAQREVVPVDNALLTIALDQLPSGQAAPVSALPEALDTTSALPVAMPQPRPSRLHADRNGGKLQVGGGSRLKADEAGTLAPKHAPATLNAAQKLPQ